MELKEIAPVVLYDDRCRLCTRFAGIVGRLGRGGLFLVGHYSPLGGRIRESLLDGDALKMFWLIDGRMAYGGRAALGPLLREILRRGPRRRGAAEVPAACGTDCSAPGAVFLRSASLLSNSRRIRLPEPAGNL